MRKILIAIAATAISTTTYAVSDSPSPSPPYCIPSDTEHPSILVVIRDDGSLTAKEATAMARRTSEMFKSPVCIAIAVIPKERAPNIRRR